MSTCLRVEQPRRRGRRKHRLLLTSLAGKRNHEGQTVQHGDLHAKRQLMHLPRLQSGAGGRGVSEGRRLFQWQRSKMLYNIRTLRN